MIYKRNPFQNWRRRINNNEMLETEMKGEESAGRLWQEACDGQRMPAVKKLWNFRCSVNVIVRWLPVNGLTVATCESVCSVSCLVFCCCCCCCAVFKQLQWPWYFSYLFFRDFLSGFVYIVFFVWRLESEMDVWVLFSFYTLRCVLNGRPHVLYYDKTCMPFPCLRLNNILSTRRTCAFCFGQFWKIVYDRCCILLLALRLLRVLQKKNNNNKNEISQTWHKNKTIRPNASRFC